MSRWGYPGRGIQARVSGTGHGCQARGAGVRRASNAVASWPRRRPTDLAPAQPSRRTPPTTSAPSPGPAPCPRSRPSDLGPRTPDAGRPPTPPDPGPTPRDAHQRPQSDPTRDVRQHRGPSPAAASRHIHQAPWTVTIAPRDHHRRSQDTHPTPGLPPAPTPHPALPGTSGNTTRTPANALDRHRPGLDRHRPAFGHARQRPPASCPALNARQRPPNPHRLPLNPRWMPSGPC